MAVNLPNGIGETLGDSLVTGKPYFGTGSVWYVSSVTGNAAFSGLTTAQPLNTLANAQTAATSGDTIVLLDGHTETYSGAVTLSKNLTIVGSGSAGGVPTVTFRVSANVGLFAISSNGTQLRNIRFQSSTAAGTSAIRVDIQADHCHVIGCYFDCSANDTGVALSISNNVTGFVCRNTTFVATNPTAAAPPGPALSFAGTSTEAWLEGLVFDGGTKGFSAGIAYREVGAATRRRGESLSFLRGADATLHASSAGSYWMPTSTTGDVRS